MNRTSKPIQLVAMLLALAIASQAHAGGPLRRVASAYTSGAQHRVAVKTDTGLVIVPFAVPVAVPVATVQQPSVLYSYRQYAEQPVVNSAVATARAPNPQGEKEGSSTPPSTISNAAAVFSRHCASCHRGGSAQGSLMLFDAAGSLVSRLPRQAIVDAIEQGRMPQPPTSTRLTPQELELLRTWAKPPKDLVY